MNTWDSLSRVVKDRTTGDVTSTDTRPVRDVYAQGMMAPQYSALTFPVAAGAHCIYEGELYAAKQDIAASEAWTAAHWDKVQLGAEVAKVGASVADLKSHLAHYEGGATGQILRKKSAADNDVEWSDVGAPTDAQVEEAVAGWLDDHPEATTTVEDYSLTADKLVTGTLGFVTPEMYGAKGDGITDDTTAIVSAINSGNPVNLSPGKTYIMTLAKVPHGFVLNGNGATIKRPNLKEPPYSRTDAQIKGEDIISFTPVNLGKQTVIRDVCFDGNAFEMWEPADEYKYEQAPLIRIAGTSDAQAKILFDNCCFKDNYASGISVANYTNISLINCSTSNCFKTAMTFVGYGSNAIVENLVHNNTVSFKNFFGPVHTEINSSDFPNAPQSNYTVRGIVGEVGAVFGALTGHGTSIIQDVNLQNIGTASDNGNPVVIINSAGGKVSINNCVFKFSESAVSCIKFNCGGDFDVSVTDTLFDASLAPDSFVSMAPGSNSKGSIKFSNCVFRGLKYGMWIGRNDEDHNVNLIFDKCRFEDITGQAVGSGATSVLKLSSITFTDCVFNLGPTAYIYKQDGTDVRQPILRFSGTKIIGENAGIRLYGLLADTLVFDNEVWDAGCTLSYYRSSRNPCVFGMRYRLLTEAPTGIAFNAHDTAIVTDPSTGTRTTYLYTGNQWVLQS